MNWMFKIVLVWHTHKQNAVPSSGPWYVKYAEDWYTAELNSIQLRRSPIPELSDCVDENIKTESKPSHSNTFAF